MSRLLPTLLVCLVAALVVGCGQSGPKRHRVTGYVTVDGEPLLHGTIQFDPDTSKGHDGPQGAAEIRDGEFATSPELGVSFGPHVVRIVGWDRSPAEGMMPPPLVDDFETRVDVALDKLDFEFDIPKPKKKSK